MSSRSLMNHWSRYIFFAHSICIFPQMLRGKLHFVAHALRWCRRVHIWWAHRSLIVVPHRLCIRVTLLYTTLTTILLQLYTRWLHKYYTLLNIYECVCVCVFISSSLAQFTAAAVKTCAQHRSLGYGTYSLLNTPSSLARSLFLSGKLQREWTALVCVLCR